MSDEIVSRTRYEAFWRTHHEAWRRSELESGRILRDSGDFAQGVRQQAGEVQSRASSERHRRRSQRRDGFYGRAQSSVHSAHVGQEFEVHYRWHPYFGCKVVVRRVEQRATGQFLKVQGPASVVVSIAGWMLDPVACAGMIMGAPHVDQIHFPRPSDEGRMTSFDWMPMRYRNVIAILKNPFYAGVYVYGKSEKRTAIVEGRARRSYGHGKPIGTWEVMIKQHHEGYISWAEYERNQKQLALNNYGRAGGVKSGRGGKALLSGIVTCGRCGRRLSVAYTGNPQSRPVYRCDKPNLMIGLPRCMTFGGPRVDAAVARELLLAVEPMAIDAAFEAERMHREQHQDRQRILDLEMQQARYEAGLAERRYAACDPDNRLIAAQLEKNWEVALRRVRDLEARHPDDRQPGIEVDPNAFTNLAENLAAAWNAPGVTMRARQQLLRTLITDIIVDVDDEARDVVLTIHWRGGQHSELRVRKPRTGEHGCATTEDALAIMRSMAGRWSDEHIAASLNRMGLPTGQGKTWTAHRVASVRRVRGIHAYRSAEKDGKWLTMTEAAKALGVTNHSIRRLIKTGILSAVQVVPGAPYQIRADDLASEAVKTAVARKGRPCRTADGNTLPMFTDT
jgi:excisionase family DNA binding protein